MLIPHNTGPVPPELGRLDTLRTLNLNGNKIDGKSGAHRSVVTFAGVFVCFLPILYSAFAEATSEYEIARELT